MSALAVVSTGLLLAAAAPLPPPAYTLQQYMAIKRANDPSFSPAADRIAFSTNATGVWQLWVTPVAKREPKQLTRFPGGMCNRASADMPFRSVRFAAEDMGRSPSHRARA